MSTITKLQIVPLRTAFPNEARDLTPWLAENLDALGERLKLELSLEQREKQVGDFHVDLLCQDAQGRKVIIENQLEDTDHDHLGKLMTYLVNLGAKTAIWVTSYPRPEHQKVIEWLNENMPEDMAFYLVKVEAIRAGESSFSPLFNVLTGPDEQAKQVGEEKKEWAQRHYDRIDFWRGLFAQEKVKGTPLANRKPQPHSAMSYSAGIPQSRFGFSVGMNDATAYVTFKFEDPAKTQAMFKQLLAERDDIEKEFGAKLTWQEEEGNKWLWIGKHFLERGLKDRSAWANLHAEMADALVRLEKIMKPRLSRAYEHCVPN